MMKHSENIKIFVVCALFLLAAGLYARSAALWQAPLAQDYAVSSQNAASLAGVSSTAANTPAVLSASSVTAQSTTAAVSTTSRDDLMADITFDYAEETEPIEMGSDFAVGPFRPTGGRVTPITVNTEVTDTLWSLGDCRAYSFTAANRGVARLSFSYNVSEVAGTPWMLYLYEAYSSDGSGENDSYRLLTQMQVTSTETGELIGDKVGIYPGSYMIIVTTGDICSVDQYTLRLAFAEGAAWEAEPNDSQNRYSELALGTRTGGASADKTGGDTDWFLFELPERGIIDLTFEHADENLPQVGWLVTLMTEDGDILYDGRSYYSDTAITSGEIGLEAGIYYVRVSSHILSTIDYYLTVDYEAISTYETELNDTLETADELPLNGEEAGVSGSLSDKNTRPDKDYYRFSPERDGVFSFSFIHQDYTRNRDGWTVSILDEAGNELYSMVSRWCDMAVTSPQIGLSAGTYYLLVDGEDMLLNSGTYVVGVTYAVGDNWEAEKNDTYETANPITLNQMTYGTLIGMGLSYDTDVYAFSLSATSSVRLLFTHEDLAQDYEGWEIGIYRADGTHITDFTSLWSQTESESELLRLAAGDYYVVVETGARFSEVRYGLQIQV